MNARWLPIVVALGFPLSAFAAGPIDGDVYGKINITLDNVDFERDGEDEWQLNSNASRFGLKGEAAITDGLAAIYKIEWQVDVDDDSTSLDSRNRYVGLTGDFGTILAGRHDTPLKLAQNKIDLFNDYLGADIANTFAGENRVNNVVMYTSPRFADRVSFAIAFGPAETGDEDDADPDFGEGGDNGFADGISAVVDYSGGPLYLALAVDRDVVQQDVLRAVGQYEFGDFQFGLMLQSNENQAGTLDERGFFVSALYQVDRFDFKAQYGQVENRDTDDEENTASLGVDYKLADATKVFVYANRNTDTTAFNLPIVGSFTLDADNTVFGIGLEHAF